MIRSKAIAIRLEVIAIRLQAIALRLEAIAIRLEAISSRLPSSVVHAGTNDKLSFVDGTPFGSAG